MNNHPTTNESAVEAKLASLTSSQGREPGAERYGSIANQLGMQIDVAGTEGS